MVTGWLFATSEPMKQIRSAPIQSLYDTVEAERPTERFIAAVDGAWQMRAELSTLFVPRNRATLPAT
jgi:hypothetical protein